MSKWLSKEYSAFQAGGVVLGVLILLWVVPQTEPVYIIGEWVGEFYSGSISFL